MKFVIPHDSLAADTLRAVIEEFITRDGAVHGHFDVSLDDQVLSLQRQLRSGKVVIIFDEESGACTMANADDWRRSERAASLDS